MLKKIATTIALPMLAGWSALAVAAAPEPFTLADKVNTATSTFVNSDLILLGGSTGPWAVSVAGGSSAQYRIASGAFTNSPGTVASGQILTVRHLSAATPATATTSTLAVGDFSTGFRSTTDTNDRIPDAFGFGGQGNVAPGALVESATVVPTGFDGAAPIQAGSGVEYRINGGAYTSAAGSLLPGQSLAVRHRASMKRLEYTKTSVRVGGVTGFFTTRTQAAYSAAAFPQGVDTDGDGVFDPADACPGTPAGTAVDAQGCSATQSFFSVGPATASEGAAALPGTLRFTVTLSRAANAAKSVKFATADGTAMVGKDYLANTGTLSFATGETSKTVTVTLIGDDCFEPAEAVSLVLSEPTGAALRTARAAGTVTDDDPKGTDFKVGAAKRVVSPRAMDIAGWPHEYCAGKMQFSYLGGFGLRDLGADPCDSPTFLEGKEPIDGVASDWHVRVMVVEQSPTNRIAYVTLDAVGAGNIIYEGVKRAVFAQTGIPKDNVVFGQTHSHAGADLQGIWGSMPFEWKQYLYAQAGAAAKEAFDNRVAADVSYAQGLIDMPSFNNYRRENMSPTGAQYTTDKRLTMIQAKRVDSGAVIGTLMQYAAHPTNVGSNNRKTHPDYIAGVTKRLEETYGGTAVFFNGPIADASPNANAASPPPGLDQYARAEFMGVSLANRAMTLLESTRKTFMPQLAVAHRTVNVAITNQLFIAVAGKGWFNGNYDFVSMAPNPDARATNVPQVVSAANTLVTRATFGKAGCECLEVVTIPGEASNVFGSYIRSLVPGRDMALLGLTQNSFGYILDEDQYASENSTTLITQPDPLYPTGYEEGVSMGPGTAPALREQGYNPLFGALPGTGGR